MRKQKEKEKENENQVDSNPNPNPNPNVPIVTNATKVVNIEFVGDFLTQSELRNVLTEILKRVSVGRLLQQLSFLLNLQTTELRQTQFSSKTREFAVKYIDYILEKIIPLNI